MEDKTRALIVTGAVLLLILGLIIAAIFYLIRFISGRSTTKTNTSQTINFSPSPVANANIGGGTGGNQGTGSTPSGNNAELKTHNGAGYQISYPKGWGLLTCSNSQNIELDPTNPTDQRVSCDWAQKAITIMSGVSCEGQTVKIGGVEVVKSQRNLSKGVEKGWCVKVGNGLMITNRVSTQDARGYGKQDYSQQIEEMISRLRVGNAS